jgi:hypothetical protein
MPKTIGELSVQELMALRGRVAATLNGAGFDHEEISFQINSASVVIWLRGCDAFNGTSVWSDVDVAEIRLAAFVTWATDDDAETAEAAMHSMIMRFPNRMNREKTHMAWVLTQQLERLGHYSSEAREAFQAAFRRSMEDAGLMALAAGAE